MTLRHGVLGATLVALAGAMFLPWLLVAGRTRSGLASAELLVSLAADGAPEGLRALGVLWYVGGFAALLAWGTAALAHELRQRWVARSLVLVSGAAWAGFVVWSIFDSRILVEWPGPTMAAVVVSGVAWSAFRVGSLGAR